MTSIGAEFAKGFDVKIGSEPTAVGEDSKILDRVMTEAIQSYLIPYSRTWADPYRRFLVLKSEWEDETYFMSMTQEICTNFAYQQIIGMGPIAIPFILGELKERPNHWFWALQAITGEDPVHPEDRGDIMKMSEAWLEWGNRHGYN